MVPRPTVLVFSAGYPPGFKQGGPIRSLESLVDRLGDELDFKIVTLDRYPGDFNSYPGIVVDKWSRRGKAEILYLGPARSGIGGIHETLMQTPHDLLYLNSFFCPRFGLAPLFFRRGLSRPSKVLLAPRGQFASSALSIKWWKKHPCLFLAKIAGLTNGVIWQATSEAERDDCLRVMGKGARVVLAPNLSMPVGQAPGSGRTKLKGELRVVFLSRIARMKNLAGAIRALGLVRGRVRFSIFGVVDDVRYWEECRNLLARLPTNVTWDYRGEVAAEEVRNILSGEDVLLMPTLGENFGHVIVESLVSGCPVLISDRTRWRGLEAAGVGWDLPLEGEAAFADVLEKLVEMDEESHAKMRAAARRYGMEVVDDPIAVEANRGMFMNLMSESRQG